MISWCTFAQVSSYLCDFENATENAQWQLNTPKNEGAEWPNLWVIGTADKCGGQQSLYISNDGGLSTNYSSTLSRVMIAWRTLTLEEGTYDITIDWKCLGGDLSKSNLRVVWIPEEDVDSKFLCGLNSEIDSRAWIVNNTITWDTGMLLGGSMIWRHSLASLTSDGKPHRLVFVWLNDNSAQALAPGACVDNVQIARNQCGKPTNMICTSTGQLALLSWTAKGDYFNLRLKCIGDGQNYEINNVHGTSVMAMLPNGAYEVSMQVICQNDTSIWYPLPVLFVYNALGFNYLSLSNDRCFFAAETPSDWHDVDLPGVLTPGRIDYGFLSENSRHTIHYYPDEVDSRTYNSIDAFGNPAPPLHTVPKGEIASVRIGSWELAAHISRVVYEFMVDSMKTGTLMIKYAMVLQMSGHEEEARPRFTLKIVDAITDEELSACTTVDFSAKTGADGWYNVPYEGDLESDQTVCWRDWTTVGLNLNEYHGRKVKVLLTAYGCTASIHYGYAYFTATCSSGMIEGIQCGDTPTDQFIAPEGFNYRWYLKSNPNQTLSTERIYDVDYQDDREYGVDISYKTNPSCGFTLSACAIPRYPVPLVSYQVYQKDCKNYIQFLNLSHIRTRNLRTGEVIETIYKPEAVLWDFDGLLSDSISQDSIPWNPILELPNEEADYHFTLTAIVGLCDSTQHIYVHVPKVGPDSVAEYVEWCHAEPYRDHKGRIFASDTIVVDRGYRNRAGCDSIHTLELHFKSISRDTTFAELLEGQTYTWEGRTYTFPTFDSIVFPLPSGCDSIRYLHLLGLGQLSVDIESVSSPCPEDNEFFIYIHAREGVPNGYSLTFDSTGLRAGLNNHEESISSVSQSLSIPITKPIQPGWYNFKVHFTSERNGETDVNSEVMVRYSSSILQQRWDDVLGILNKENNGGYDFISFQWFKDNEPIEGAVYPYLYEPNKLTLSEYSVLLMKDGETRGVMTCPYTPVMMQKTLEQTSENKFVQNGQLYIRYNNQVYNAQGQPVRYIN